MANNDVKGQCCRKVDTDCTESNSEVTRCSNDSCEKFLSLNLSQYMHSPSLCALFLAWPVQVSFLMYHARIQL